LPVGSETTSVEITLTLNPSIHRQTIQGFGVNFNGTYFRREQEEAVARPQSSCAVFESVEQGTKRRRAIPFLLSSACFGSTHSNIT
jgi:hypothetical protein